MATRHISLLIITVWAVNTKFVSDVNQCCTCKIGKKSLLNVSFYEPEVWAPSLPSPSHYTKPNPLRTWYVEIKWPEHDTWERNTQKVCLLYSQNNTIVYMWICRHIFGEIREVRNDLWTFSFTWFCFSDADWLGRQTPITITWRELLITMEHFLQRQPKFWIAILNCISEVRVRLLRPVRQIPEQLFVPQDLQFNDHNLYE